MANVISKRSHITCTLVMLLAGAAFAQPLSDNLGSANIGQSVSGSAVVAPGGVRWFAVTIPAIGQSVDRFMDVQVQPRYFPGSNINQLQDSVVAVYSSSGNLIAYDDDSGPAQRPMLTMGMGYPARPCTGCDRPRDGSDLDPNDTLPAGTYYVAVAGYPVIFSPGSFAITAGSAADSGGVYITLQVGGRTQPLVVQADALAAYNCGYVPTLVTARPFAAPSNAAVTVNLTSIGLDPVREMRDDGFEGDVQANDGVYSSLVYVPNFVLPDVYSLPVSVAGSIGVTNALLRIEECPAFGIGIEEGDTGEAGESQSQVQVILGSGSLTAIAGEIMPEDADVFEIEICDAVAFSASTVGSAAFDTQLFLFTTGGNAIVMNDDSEQLSSQSRITGAYVADGGRYYLAIAPFDIDPVDNDGLPIWQDTPFHAQRQPDGPSESALLAGWFRNVPTRGGSYMIQLTGACFITPPVTCNPCPADYNNDGGVDGGDIESFFADWSAGGGDLGCADVNFDGGVDGSDIEIFFAAWSIGGC